MRRRLRVLWRAYQLWLRCDCIDLSAAFAFHTLQSFFPALLIALAIASRLLGRDETLLNQAKLLLAQLIPSESLPVVADALSRFLRQGFGAGIVGVLLLLLNANNIYLTLQRGADRLWWNRPHDTESLSWVKIIQRFLLLRLKSLFILLLVGPLLLVDQVIGNIRIFGSTILRAWFSNLLPAHLIWLGNLSAGADLLLSNILAFASILVLLWLLPSRRVPIRPLIPGALLISSITTILTIILGRLLFAIGLKYQAYGVVGGVLLLTFWLWLLGVILYFGQCLSVTIAGVPSAMSLVKGGRSTPSQLQQR
ncbi:MAG: YihY/virulence factor BrkB family protein [Cyanobacteriota bacterium]|jgi:membrane protein|nr:YihY/virulence factor BrkB family protein [Cyanobacteriota bacterium]